MHISPACLFFFKGLQILIHLLPDDADSFIPGRGIQKAQKVVKASVFRDQADVLYCGIYEV